MGKNLQMTFPEFAQGKIVNLPLFYRFGGGSGR